MRILLDLPKKKIGRRTRNEGIGGGKEFTDWGARKMILLAVVHKVPESHYNIGLIFDNIYNKINTLNK